MPKEAQPIKCHLCGTLLADMEHFRRDKKVHKRKFADSELSHPGTWELVSTNGRLVPAMRRMLGKKVRDSDRE